MTTMLFTGAVVNSKHHENKSQLYPCHRSQSLGLAEVPDPVEPEEFLGICWSKNTADFTLTWNQVKAQQLERITAP